MPRAQAAIPSEADWRLVAGLFPDEVTAFRHHMGLARRSFAEFYAPTEQADSIHAEKQEILASPAADQYLLATGAGQPFFEEFTRLSADLAGLPDAKRDQHALHRSITLALEPDWLLLAPPDWRLVWASVCFPSRWSLAGKALAPLADTHAVVPELAQELGRKIDLFFARIAPGEGWGRANWGLSRRADRNQHPALPHNALSGETRIEEIWLRVESQHLLKLPGTGAVAFGIRILNFPLAEAAKRPSIAAGLKQQLRTMSAEVAAYKGIPRDLWRLL